MAKGGRRKVGEAYVELRADSTKLGPELEKMRKETDKTAKQVEGDTKKIGEGFKGVGNQIEKNTEGFRKLSGAISSTIGIWTGVAGAISIVVGLLAAAYVGMRKFADSFSPLEKAKKKIEDINNELERTKAINEALTQGSPEVRNQTFLTEASRLDNQILGLQTSISRAAGRGRTAQTHNAVRDAQERLDELLRERSRLNQLALRGVQNTAQADTPASPASTAQVSPLDSGGQLTASAGTLQSVQAVMSQMLARLEGIERGIRDATQQ